MMIRESGLLFWAILCIVASQVTHRQELMLDSNAEKDD